MPRKKERSLCNEELQLLESLSSKHDIIRQLYSCIDDVIQVNHVWLVGAAEFKAFIKEKVPKNKKINWDEVNAIIRSEFTRDFRNAVAAFESIISERVKISNQTQKRSVHERSPTFLHIRSKKKSANFPLKLSSAEKAIRAFDLRNPDSSCLEQKVSELFGCYKKLDEEIWQKISEFDKYVQDRGRYKAAIWGLYIAVVALILNLIFEVYKFLNAPPQPVPVTEAAERPPVKADLKDSLN